MKNRVKSVFFEVTYSSAIQCVQ